MTHTEEPWEAHQDTLENDWIVDSVPLRIGKHGRVVVAEVPNTTDEADSPEPEANARLIAAAPDLLQALDGLLKTALGLYSAIAPHGNFADSDPHVKAARDAIKKARGES